MKIIVTTIRSHDNLSRGAGIIGNQTQASWIGHGVGKNVPHVELFVFENQFLQ